MTSVRSFPTITAIVELVCDSKTFGNGIAKAQECVRLPVRILRQFFIRVPDLALVLMMKSIIILSNRNCFYLRISTIRGLFVKAGMSFFIFSKDSFQSAAPKVSV
jgi:hypothetical protein